MLKRLRKKRENQTPFFLYRDGERIAVDLRGLYKGAACFFVSNGPSINDVDLDKLRQPGILTWGINNGPKVFRPKLWCCMDTPAKFLESVWLDPGIIKFSTSESMNDKISRRLREDWEYFGPTVGSCPSVVHVKRNNKFIARRFFTEPTANWGNHKDYGGSRSVFICSIKIMYMLGIARIYLVGADFSMSEDKKYAFDEQRARGAIKSNNNSYLEMNAMFATLGPYMPKGFHVYNCTPGSGLTALPYMKLETALGNELRDFPDPAKEQSWGNYLPGDGKKISPDDKKKWRKLHG